RRVEPERPGPGDAARGDPGRGDRGDRCPGGQGAGSGRWQPRRRDHGGRSERPPAAEPDDHGDRHLGNPDLRRAKDLRRTCWWGRGAAPGVAREGARGVGVVATVGAIVAAAGTGSRLGRGSKALVRLNGKTTLARVLELFLALDEIDRIVVVGPPSRLESAEREVMALQPRKPVVVRAGGESRQDSVRAGLGALGDCDYVLVHDAARPLAT